MQHFYCFQRQNSHANTKHLRGGRINIVILVRTRFGFSVGKKIRIDLEK